MGSEMCIRDRVKKVYFPRSVLPTASTLAWLTSFGVEMAVLGVVLLAVGNFIVPWIPVVLVLMALQTVFLLGLGLILSAANAYFRDVQHFLAIGLNIWFYATPIIYPPDQVPKSFTVAGITIPIRAILRLNPMVPFVDAYRDVLYNLRWPALSQWGSMTLIALASLALGAAVFRRLEPRLAEEL